MKLILLILCLLCSVSIARADYPAEANGASPSASNNTPAIQTTLDQAGAAGGGVVSISTPGTYLLQTQGANPYDTGHLYCLEVRYDNITVSLGQGVTLKLADGQQASSPVDVIVFHSKHNLVFRGASNGSSIITANASGQSWTGGYAQLHHGIIISGYTTFLPNRNISIIDLTLRDHFSNSINFGASNPDVRSDNIRIARVRSIDCGEGIQVIHADDVWIEDCFVDNPTPASATGDSIEVANVARFHIRGCTVRRSGASSFDIFGSNSGVVEDFISDQSANGINIHPFTGSYESHDIVIQNGFVNVPEITGADGVEILGALLTNITVSNVKVKGAPGTAGILGPGFSTFKASGPVSIINCEVTGAQNGMLIGVMSDLTVRGGNYSNNIDDGLRFSYPTGLSPNDVKNLRIEGVSATNNGRYGIFIDNQGNTVPTITGAITDCVLDNNGTAPIIGGLECGGIYIANLIPSDIHGGDNASVFGTSRFYPTANISSFVNPSKDQVLMITPDQPCTIIDARQGGNNIYLNGALSVNLQSGDTLTLRFEGSRWNEVSRSINH